MLVAKTDSRSAIHDPRVSAEDALRVTSPAKVNLYLGVTGLRADGFHELATIFERITLADTLFFEPRDAGVTCACDDPRVPTDGRNLAVRAARLLQERCGVAQGVHVTLQKHIPASAGLGGGSSNAATTLTALNAWWRLGLSRQALMALGRELGADVPFFLAEAPFALGVGRGDVILPLPTAATFWHVLVTPPVALSTAEVFRAWDALGSSAGGANIAQLARLLTALLEGAAAAASAATWNQLTPAAARLAPVIRDVETALTRCGARAVSLSGSGPTVVATVVTEDAAHAMAARVGQTHPEWRVIVTSTAPQASEHHQ